MRVWWLVVWVGCAQHHVRLDPPPADLTPEQRVSLFEKRRPVVTATLLESINGGPWEQVSSTIELGDKTEVVSPEDLAPLVRSDSETMQKARASVVARRRHNVGNITMMTAAAVGLVLSGVFVDVPIPYAPYIGWPTFFAAAIIGMPVTRYLGRTEIRLLKQAFASYTRDLAERLNLCSRGLKVVPCETPRQPPPERREPATTVPSRTAALKMR